MSYVPRGARLIPRSGLSSTYARPVTRWPGRSGRNLTGSLVRPSFGSLGRSLGSSLGSMRVGARRILPWPFGYAGAAATATPPSVTQGTTAALVHQNGGAWDTSLTQPRQSQWGDTLWPFYTSESGEPRPQPGGQGTITGPNTLPASDDIDTITAVNTIANTKSNNGVFAPNDIGTNGATGTQSWPDTTATTPAKTTTSNPGRKKEVSFAPESKGTTKFGDQWSAEKRRKMFLETLTSKQQEEFDSLHAFGQAKKIRKYMGELEDAAKSAPPNKNPLNEWAIMEASRKQTKHVRDVLTTTGLAPSIQTIQSVARTLMDGALEELGYEADTLAAFKWDEVEPGWRDKAKACPDANWITLGNEHDKKVWFEQIWKPRNPSTKTDEEAFKDFEKQTKGTMFQVKPDDPIYSQLSAFGGAPAPLDFDTFATNPENLQKLQTMMNIENKTKADGGNNAAVDKAWEDALGPRPPPTPTATVDGAVVENVQGTPSETTTGEPKDQTTVTSEQRSKSTANLPVNTNMNNPFAPTEYDYEVAKSVKWTERLTEYNAIMEKRAADRKKAEAELAQKIAEAKEANRNPFKIVLGPSKHGATSLGSLMSDSTSTTPQESSGTSVPLAWSGHGLDEWIMNIETRKKKLTQANWQTIADRALTESKNSFAIRKHFPELNRDKRTQASTYMTDTNYIPELKKTMKKDVMDYLASQLGEEAVTDAKLEAMFNEKGRHTAYNGQLARAWAEGKGGPKAYPPSTQVNRLRVLASLAPMGETAAQAFAIGTWRADSLMKGNDRLDKGSEEATKRLKEVNAFIEAELKKNPSYQPDVNTAWIEATT